VGRLGTVSGVISGFSGEGTSVGLSGFVFLAIIFRLQSENAKAIPASKAECGTRNAERKGLLL
jgi:hypothetical protein